MKKKKFFIKEILKTGKISQDEFNHVVQKILNPFQYSIYKMRFDKEGNIKNGMKYIAEQFNCSKQNIEQKLNVIYKTIEKHVKSININITGFTEDMDFETKANILIETIDKLHRLPYKKECIFPNDETSQLDFYMLLCERMETINEKIHNNETLSKEEKYIRNLFNKIEKHLEITTVTPKTQQLINTIDELQRLPKTKQLNGGNSERIFDDGTDQRRYYDVLLADIKRIRKKQYEKKELTHLEKQKIFDYNKVRDTIDKYADVISYKPRRRQTVYLSELENLDNKTEALIDTIRDLKRLPKVSIDYANTPEKVFDDGTNQRSFYISLRKRSGFLANQKKQGAQLNILDEKKLACYEKLVKLLEFYPITYYQGKKLIKTLCNDLNIDLETNPQLLAKSFREVYVKLRYLQDNNIDYLNDNNEIHEIMYMSEPNMIEKYNITIDELIKAYIDGTLGLEDSIKILTK